MTDKPLTPQQENFCKAVVSGLSLSDSYRKAYKAGKMKANSINVSASKLMADPKVTLRVVSLKAEVNAEFVIDTSALLQESYRVAHSDVRNIFHADGKIKLVRIGALSREDMDQAIASILN